MAGRTQLLLCATLAVVAAVATAGSAPAPPANASFVVAVNWTAAPLSVFRQDVSVQIVAQHYLFRDSPDVAVYNASWQAIADLQARAVRFAGWFPYALAGVAELDPPSGTLLCGPAAWASTAGQLRPVTLNCRSSTIAAVEFASWGTPTGTCGSYALGSCHVANSSAIVASACVGKSSCTLDPSVFGGTAACPGAKPAAHLAVQVRCADPTMQHAYWDLESYVAPLLDDAMAAVGEDSDPIPSFSTAPTWLYSPTDYSYEDDPLVPNYSYNKGTAPAVNGSALGDYYGRLFAYFTNGSFVDEAGVTVSRPPGAPTYSFKWIEVGNEVDYEHGHTPQSYTADFDSIVSGIRRWTGGAGRGGQPLRFNGMNLPNIDDTPTVLRWAQYFLNASNHAPDVRDANALAYIGYHAYPTQGGFSPDPTSFAGMFTYVDQLFVPKVLAIDAAIAQLHPSTRTILDECGVDMDGVLSSGVPPPGNNPRFWVASGAYFAYLTSSIAALPNTTVVQIGHSQVMDAPGQEPSVTLLDWSTGRGTAAYWVTWMVIRAFAIGDVLLPASVSAGVRGASELGADAQLHARAFLHTPAPGRPDLPGASTAANSTRLLLVNKGNSFLTVALPPPAAALMASRQQEAASAGAAAGASTGAGYTCSAWVVDERNGLNPPAEVDCSGPSPAGGSLLLFPYATAAVEFVDQDLQL